MVNHISRTKLHLNMNLNAKLPHASAFFFFFLVISDSISKKGVRGAQPKYTGGLQEKHQSRSRKKIKNQETLILEMQEHL
jgi:hypothetical protein